MALRASIAAFTIAHLMGCTPIPSRHEIAMDGLVQRYRIAQEYYHKCMDIAGNHMDKQQRCINETRQRTYELDREYDQIQEDRRTEEVTRSIDQLTDELRRQQHEPRRPLECRDYGLGVIRCY